MVPMMPVAVRDSPRAVTGMSASGEKVAGRAARCGNDEGQVTGLMLIPLVIGLVVLTVALMVGLGDGVRSRTQTRTAADAAALAAANAWQGELRARYDLVRLAPDVSVALRELLATDPRMLSAGSTDAAHRFAARNSGTIEATRLTAQNTGLLFEVRTRSTTRTAETDQPTYAHAVARVEIASPLCLDGGRFGLRSGSGCLLPGEGLPVAGPLPIPAAGLPDLRTEVWLVT
ncbi:MAG: hypothetical protein QG671_2012 [Actinomycetota bacterium]|nr:hypothetical protein [Actinomycetota bacterium]